MNATEILSNEHRVIEQVLACLELMIEDCERSRRLSDPESAGQAVSFFRGFADQCHHAKEESELFRLMERCGYPADSGPTAVMRAEHEQSRNLLATLEQAIPGAARGDVRSLATFISAGRGYIGLLRRHIDKEDHCLFPMAMQALTATDQADLLASFARIERDEIGEGVHEGFHRIADALVRRFDVREEVGGCACNCVERER